MRLLELLLGRPLRSDEVAVERIGTHPRSTSATWRARSWWSRC